MAKKKKYSEAAAYQAAARPVVDEEDRKVAEEAKAERKRRKRKRVVVKKPLPVPSMEAAWKVDRPETPKKSYPQPGPSKPRPHGGHLPTRYRYVPPVDLAVGETPERKREIDRYNQAREARRRADNRARRAMEKAEREARRDLVRKLSPKVRDMVGRDRVQDFIRTGRPLQDPGLLDYAGAIGSAALGAAGKATTDFTSRLSAGLRGRESGEEYTAGNDPFLNALGEGLVGHNIMNLVSGEDYDTGGLLLEMGLLFVPLKGLPTPVTAALRGLVGAQRLARMERAGMTVADIAEELQRPVMSVRAARRARLRGAVPGMEAPHASSWGAGVAAKGLEKVPGMGRLATIVRNDPRTMRRIVHEGAVVETPADLSRTWKYAVRPLLDKSRAVTGRVPGITSRRRLWGKTLARQLAAEQMRYAATFKKVPRELEAVVARAGWPGVYALRSVLKNIPIGEMIQTTEQNLKVALARGDKMKSAALRAHLAYFRKAADFVTQDANGRPVLRDDSPISMEDLRAALGDVSAEREHIVGDVLGELSDARANARILNEQLLYHGAKLQTGEQHAAAALTEHPVRQKIDAYAGKNLTPEQREYTMTVLDARSRQAYDLEKEKQIAAAQFKREAAATTDDPARREDLLRQAQRHEDRAHTITPAYLYDNIEEFADEIPAELLERLSQEWGMPGKDWLFSLDDPIKVDAAVGRISKEILDSGLPLPPEMDTPEKLAAAIEEVFELARAGQHGKDWYKNAATVVMRVSDETGIPPKQVAQLVAIFSQAADTVSNMTFVFDAIEQWQRYGDVFTGRFPGRQGEEALAVLRGEGYEGRKRNSFYANILRHLPGMEDEYAATIREMAEERGAEIRHPVTVDRWVVRMFRPDAEKDVPERYYDTFETIMQKMGDATGLEPEQIQAAAWVAKKQADLDASLAKGGRRTARHAAGGQDAFEYGAERALAKRAEGSVRVVNPQAKRLANQANKKWGGFTVHPDLTPVEEVGYSVTMSLTERAFKLHGLKGEDIEQFADDYAELLKDKRNRIGGFSDDQNDVGDGTDLTYLSVTRHFKTKAAALKFAREQGQETVYEYKTGDGIRTGLTRDEQADIISKLDPASLKGGPLSNVQHLTATEQARYDFFTKAAREFGFARGKRGATDKQRNAVERWFEDHAHEYPDEPIVQEYEALPRVPQEEPDWMLKAEDVFRMSAEGPARRIMGAWEPKEQRLWYSEYAHPLDWWHEVVHVMDTENLWAPEVKKAVYAHLGIDPTKKLTTQQAEDIADLFEAMVVGFDMEASSLPTSVKRALRAMKTDVWNSERGFADAHAVLATLPEDVRLRLEDVLAYKEEGMAFRGPRDTFRGGEGVYTPEVPGLPFSWASVNAPRRMHTQWQRLIHGEKVVSLTPADAHLENAFTGALIESGLWDPDITRGPLEGLLKAMEMQKMAEVHRLMVEVGTSVPTHSSDIMLAVDPKAWASDMRAETGEVFRILEALDPNKKITSQMLSKTDAIGIEQTKAIYFPGMDEGSEQAVRELAAALEQAQAEIPGIVWVSRKQLLATGLFDKPGLKYTMGAGGRLALDAADFANNIAKMLTLSLNPAYYPMNMAGQAIMMGVQQGFMAPFTLARALNAWRSYTDEQLAVIDHAAGLGLGSIVHAKPGTVAHQATDAVARVTDILIDRYPRRAAFFYEARRLGYKTRAEVMDLVENPARTRDLYIVSERTNRAMVDFRDMGRMEREIATRLIFVYPWLKGSAKYMGQFVADHPIQAALFAGLLYWQQQRLREAFPEGHPGYMKWFFPVKIPGEGEGTPYGFRLDQFFTPLQPLDLAAEIVYWTTPFEVPWGSNEEALVGRTNPLIEEIAKTIAGWDSFTREEVSHNILDMFQRMVSPEDRWSSWKRLKKVIDHSEHEGLYDTTQFQNWLRLFLGSTAPVNVDPEVAADMAQARKTISVEDKTPEERVDDFMEKAEEANGGPLSESDAATIRSWKQNDIVHGQIENEYKREHDKEYTDAQDKVVILLLTIAELKPEKAELAKSRIPAALAASDEDAEAAVDELRKALGLSQLGTLNYRISKRRRELEKEAKVGS